MFETLIIITGLFALLAGILEWQLAPLRTLAALFFILYGVSSFPYAKEDRYKIGLAVGCVAFSVSGLLAIFTRSWYPLAGGPLCAYGLAWLLGRREREVLAARAVWTNSLAAVAPSLAEEFRVRDNFEYIAFNMAVIRCALEDDYGDRFAAEDDLLLACGVVDTLLHIVDADFGIDDVKDGFT
jgi:hypothetical protein